MTVDIALEAYPNGLRSAVERRRVLSATRLKLALGVFVLGLVLGLSAMMFVGVSRIFEWLTPTIRTDIARKARHGALELAEAAQIGLVVRDIQAIAKSAREYIVDPEVLAVVALDANGQRLLAHSRGPQDLTKLFATSPNVAHDLGTAYGAWALSTIEGLEVGRIGLLVSKARLEAGLRLRHEVLVAASVGCLFALGLCIVFVSAYIGPILRVTEQAFLRLEVTTEAALAATRLKSQFLANMSHEIRTPMNGIVGVLELLNLTELTSKQRRYTKIIDASGRSLLTIINDVLDFSKLEAGKYVLRSDEFELRQLTQEVAELLSPSAEDKGIELVVRIDPQVPHSVFGDFDRVKQVLNNLIGNAIKFTERGHVALRVSVDASASDALMLRFAVTDTGLGIREEDQVRLFGMFSQVDGSLTRKYGGTGLGLAISKQLAQAMGGSVRVTSELGHGSTFCFTMATRIGLAEGVCQVGRKADVLLICAGQALRENVQELLERWGMACTLAQNETDAHALIVSRESQFDIVLLDGFRTAGSATPSLLEVCVGEGIPVIHILSSSQQTAMGPTHSPLNYLLKPLRASELYNALLGILDHGSSQPRKLATSSPHKRNAVVLRRSRVLIVDDNEINRLVATDLLTELGHLSDTASNGVEAVSKAATGRYGAILMDCQMPDLDGYEATRQIRALPEPASKVPIIALTAHALDGDRERVLAAGMDDYTAKPIRIGALQQLLRRWDSDALELRNGQPMQESASQPVQRAVPTTHDAVAQAGATTHDFGHLPDLDLTLPRSEPVVALFLRTVPDLLAALAGAVGQGDTTAISRLAHKLKGNCLSIGATKMAAGCQAVEHASERGVQQAAYSQLPGLYLALTSALEPRRISQLPDDLSAPGSQHG